MVSGAYFSILCILSQTEGLFSETYLRKLGLSWCTGTRGNSYCFHIHTWSCDAVRQCFVPLCTGTRGHNQKANLDLKILEDAL